MNLLQANFRLLVISITVIAASLIAGLTIITVVAIDSQGGDVVLRGDPGDPVTELTVVARDIAFEPDAFAVPAGEDITVTFDNQDDGVPHNITFEDIDDASISIESGPDTRELTFAAPAPGEYEYLCDAHPAQMRGLLVVE